MSIQKDSLNLSCIYYLIAISINQKEKIMKKFFAGILSVLLVAFLATAFNSSGKKEVIKDVGYSLTIDQNVPIVTIFTCESPVLIGENYMISRGVSVPYKGLTNEAIYVNFKNQNFQMCRVDNYSQSWQRSINTNLETPVKGINLLASDLGTWERLQNKT